MGIKSIERAIIDRAWKAGWVKPEVATQKSGMSVAVVGSGPAGMACAQQLARVGHNVVIFEKSGRPGGLLRYGIPDFKLPKHLIDRRVEQMQKEGFPFQLSTAVGTEHFSAGVGNMATKSISAQKLMQSFDAVVLSCGSEFHEI